MIKFQKTQIFSPQMKNKQNKEMIKDTPLFLRTTEKLYNEVKNRKKRNGLIGSPHFEHLDIEIEKIFFEEDEWEFLEEYEDKFKFPVQINGSEIHSFNVYKIENKKLKTNELNIWGIRSKFSE